MTVQFAPDRSVLRQRTVSFAQELEKFGAKLALVDSGGRRVSFEGLAQAADRMGESLGGSRRLVVLEADDSIDTVAAYLACLRGGHPVLLCAPGSEPKLGPILERYTPNVIVSGGGATMCWRHDKPMALHAELAVLLSTSGSTGSPKLVKLSYRNLESNARAIAAYLRLDDSERAMITLPFQYAYGLSVLNSHFVAGGAGILSRHAVTDEAFWTAFRTHGCTSFAGVPYTFESLHQAGFAFENVSTLRYATQAGGRLDPALVRHFGQIARRQGWRFIVMYGQTEAAPRMAWLPPDLTLEFPDCIGIPIPGGQLDLLDDDGRVIREAGRTGHLAYSGPNVMMGYAECADDLATDQTPHRLLTGDLACRRPNGLICLTGRASRVVKPFGLRINLDELEAGLRTSIPEARCAGDDARIVIAVPPGADQAARSRVAELAASCGLPTFMFHTVAVGEMPRLSSGKVDYGRILTLAKDRTPPREPLATTSPLGVVFSARFVDRYVREVVDMLGLRPREWRSVREIYTTLLETAHVSDADSFTALGGDSLSYVQLAAALTDHLGALPSDWPARTVAELELLRRTHHDAAL